MEWNRIWQTVFCGDDSDVAGVTLPGDRARPPAHAAGTTATPWLAAERSGLLDAAARTEDDDPALWVCRRIQQAF
ncbi:MAG: hypothetical protein QN157_01075 [Armatimonadota bacterium]|nr:hypothetical protein [Armatimonadota bacterium]